MDLMSVELNPRLSPAYDLIQGGDPFGSRGTTSSGAFDISALRPATDPGLERREASAAPKKAQEGEGTRFLGAQPARKPIFFLDK